MNLHFIDQNGNHFVVPDAPDGYEREDATLVPERPSPQHEWRDGQWRWIEGSLVNAKAAKVTEVRALAEAKILAILPIYAQINALRDGTHADEFARIDAIRSHANALESEVHAKRTHHTLAAVIIESGWPE